MSRDILEEFDISVTFRRKQGERRNPIVLNRKKPKPYTYTEVEVFNPFPVIINHRKHSGKVYREATGGVEKSFPRFYGVLLD